MARFKKALERLVSSVRPGDDVATCSENSTRQATAMVFHMGRCGSTVLSNQLLQHPSIGWGDEALQPQRMIRLYGEDYVKTHNVFDVLRTDLAEAKSAVFGFEAQPYQVEPFGVRMPDFIRGVEELGVDHFIVLERKNYIRVIVSVMISQRANTWHKQKGDKSSLQQVELNLENLFGDDMTMLEYLELYERTHQEALDLVQGKNYLHVTYEDHIAEDPRVAYQNVCAFLGLDAHPAEVRLKKFNPFGLDEIIVNHAEVAELVEGTRFEWMAAG